MKINKLFMRIIGCAVIILLLVGCQCSANPPAAPMPEGPQPQSQPPQPGAPQPPPGDSQPMPQPGSDTAPGGSQPLPQPTTNTAPGGGQPAPTNTSTGASGWNMVTVAYEDLAISGMSVEGSSWGWELAIHIYNNGSSDAEWPATKCTGSITGATGKNTAIVKEAKDFTYSIPSGSTGVVRITLAEIDSEDALMNGYITCTISNTDGNSQNNTYTCNFTSCGKTDTCICK